MPLNEALCFKASMSVNPTSFNFDERFEKFKELGRYVSDSKLHVAVFGEKPDLTYTYVIYSWDLSEYDCIGEGFWSSSSCGGIYSNLLSVKSDAQRDLGLVSS